MAEVVQAREGSWVRQWGPLLVLAAGLSMIVLDGTIVGVALPRIIADLHLGLTQAQWVNSLYSVVFAALLLGAGWLGDRFGRRAVFVAGVILFVLGSAVAALSGSATGLIAARAIQGVGGAGVLPASLSSVNARYRGRDRAVAFGIWGAVMAGMAAIGPLLGGWLTSSFGWRWVFLVNLPLGVVVAALAVLLVPESRAGTSAGRLDLAGLLTSALGFGLLVFGTIEGSKLGWWHQATDFTLGVAHWHRGDAVSAALEALLLGAVFLAAFVAWELHRARTGRDALLDLSLFRHATFGWGNATAMSVAVGEFILVFILPLYLVNARGLGIMGAGWVLSAMAIGAFLSGASARHLAERLGAAGVVVLGLALELMGATGTALAVHQLSGVAWLVAALTVYGLGLGLASAQLTSTVLSEVPTEQSGTGSATQSTVRQVGSALGAALGGGLLAARLLPDLTSATSALHLPTAQLAPVLQMAVDSVGAGIPSLRSQGQAALADALSRGFAHASATGLTVSIAALLLGLVGSLVVARAARRTTH